MHKLTVVDLGAIAAMCKGNFVFWFQRSQDGFTGLLEVVQNNDFDPTIAIERKSVKRKLAFATRTKNIKPGILRCHLQWRATFAQPITSYAINSSQMFETTILHRIVAASTTLPKAEHDTALTKRREARKKWKKSNKESYDRQHTRFLARESDYKPAKDLGRYGDYDCVDTGLSTVENKDGTVTTTVKKMINQYSPLYLWWKTRKLRAFFPLSYKEVDMLLQLCDIKSIHPSLESKGSTCDANELRKRARRVRGGKKADTEKPLTTRIGVV
ncbi:hypothetical protein Cpir12675_001506 [Ceratocystis pirilliformis]|uniref:Uncharacterized protein n=1 Tax=Ceratocystis pirilliformis TaxID=259994 RepID=A0ABR3ZF35_9PEZI